MSALGPPLFSGFVIVRLRPELAQWLRAAYMADPNVSFPKLSDLANVWRTTPPQVAGLSPTDIQLQSDQLHGAIASIPSPTAVDPALIRPTIIRENQIPVPSPYQPVRSLVAYFRFDTRGLSALNVDTFVNQMASLTILFDAVEREPGLSPPAATRVNWEDDVDPNGGIDASWQLHTEAEVASGSGTLQGIHCNAPEVWDDGFDGTGVGFVDIEVGWRLDHPDLPAPLHDNGVAKTPFYNDNDPAFEYHGTAALGIVVGVDNTEGIVGIAPQASFIGVASYQKGADPGDITNAILHSLTHMQVGDVLLLEVQTTGGGAFPGAEINLPVEVVDLWFDAIRLAVGSGMVVIEPAGNGHDVGGIKLGYDLDQVTSVSSTRSLDRDAWPVGAQHLLDSGAIVVAACFSDVVDGQMTRMDTCNSGSRVDCYAWGEEVYTTSNGAGASAYGVFGETSAASAIIAGAAILVQQMWRKRFGTSASCAEIRSLLSTYGTPVSEQKVVQPDLAIIASKLDVAPDIFVRDHVGDDGTVPGAFTSQSPDIILLTNAVGNPQATFGEGSGTENSVVPNDPVAPGADNYLYVRVRNRNTSDAANTVARVYWAEASTLIVPTDWHFIGESEQVIVPGAPMGSSFGPLTVTKAIVWSPIAGATPPQMPATHGCFIALVSCPSDAPPPAIIANAGPSGSPTRWSDFLDFIGRNNNAAWRNFTILGAPLAAGLLIAEARFFINAAPRAQRFDFQVLHRLPKGAKVQLKLESPLAKLFSRALGYRHQDENEGERSLTMEHDTKFFVPSVTLPARQRYRCAIRFTVDRDVRPQPIEWAIRQLHRGREVGRVTFALDKRSWEHAPQA